MNLLAKIFQHYQGCKHFQLQKAPVDLWNVNTAPFQSKSLYFLFPNRHFDVPCYLQGCISNILGWKSKSLDHAKIGPTAAASSFLRCFLPAFLPSWSAALTFVYIIIHIIIYIYNIYIQYTHVYNDEYVYIYILILSHTWFSWSSNKNDPQKKKKCFLTPIPPEGGVYVDLSINSMIPQTKKNEPTNAENDCTTPKHNCGWNPTVFSSNHQQPTQQPTPSRYETLCWIWMLCFDHLTIFDAMFLRVSRHRW